MIVRVKVSPRAAIMGRKATAGISSIEIKDGDIETLDESVLEEIVGVVESDEVVDLPGADPTVSAFISVMTERAHAKRHKELDDAQQVLDAMEAASAEREKDSARETERTHAIMLWVRNNGTDEQRARLAEGLLPFDEVIEDVTEDLIDINEPEY